MINLTVQAKVIGQRKPSFPNWVIPIPPDNRSDHLRLRDLITRVVREEVAAYNQRQNERPLIRFLSKSQIEQAAVAGKISMGGDEAGVLADETTAIDSALLAFTDGIYFVFVDEVQQEDLDAELFLKPDSQVTFLRLTPLVGG
jgi:hypothetical protein